MTSNCNIGPITTTQAHIYDNNTINLDGSETFTITCTNKEAKQIMGLSAIQSNNQKTGNTTTINTDNPWSIIWIDTSNTLTPNDYIVHRGWYIINNANITTDMGPDNVHLEVTATKISPYENEYLEMDYTVGVNDGTKIDHTYSLLTPSYDLNDTFSSFDTTNTWYPMATDATATTPSITSDGSDLTFTTGSSSDGTQSGIQTTTRTTFNKPFTLDFNLKYTATPSGGSYSNGMNWFIGPTANTGMSGYNNSILIVFNNNTTVPYYCAYLFNNAGASTKIIGDTNTTAKSLNFRIVADAVGYIDIYVDTGAGYVKKYHGVTWLDAWDLYVNYQFVNSDSTSASIKSEYCQVYNMAEGTTNNIIALPSTTPVTSSDFTRVSSDGTIPCYANPSESLYFYQEDASHFYDGSVKAYNSNYADSTPRLITWTDEVLDPSKFYVSNGLIKLTTNTTATTPVVFSYYSSSSWTDLQGLGTGESIKLLKPLFVSPEKHVYQINDTKWTMNRGKQHIIVEHPTTPITITEVDYYEHDSTITVTPSSTPLTMATSYYCNAYNTSPCTYGFQIMKTDPTTIYSDYIPAADITGLGWYNNSTSPTTSYNHYIQLANEFLTQTRTQVNVRQL